MSDATHILSVEAQAFHRLRFAKVTLEPGAGLVRVTGANGAGKTSLLKAIMAALGGSGLVSTEAIQEGAADGSTVTLALSNGFTVKRRMTEANPKGYLTVVGPDGGKHAQSKLDEWLGPRAFDPLSFFGLKPEKQRDVLFSIAKDPNLPTQLAAVRADRQTLYEQRTPHISMARRMRQTPQPDGERPERVDVSADMRELEELEQQAKGVQARRRTRDNAAVEVKRLKESIAVQEARLAEEKRRLASLVEGFVVMEEELATLADPAEQITAVRARISSASERAKALRPWEEYDRAQREAVDHEQEVARLTAALEAAERHERELLEGAGIPVEGLGFDAASGEPTLNGRPLSVASGRERIQLAVAVALAANPELRISLLDEANDLDLESMEELKRLAVEHDFQIWAVRIGLEGPGEIVVEDGVAHNVGASAEEEGGGV